MPNARYRTQTSFLPISLLNACNHHNDYPYSHNVTGTAKQLSIKVWLLKIPYNNQHLPWSPYSSQLITLIQSRALRGAMTIDHMIC